MFTSVRIAAAGALLALAACVDATAPPTPAPTATPAVVRSATIDWIAQVDPLMRYCLGAIEAQAQGQPVLNLPGYERQSNSTYSNKPEKGLFSSATQASVTYKPGRKLISCTISFHGIHEGYLRGIHPTEDAVLDKALQVAEQLGYVLRPTNSKGDRGPYLAKNGKEIYFSRSVRDNQGLRVTQILFYFRPG